MDKCEQLRELLAHEKPLIMPDAYDPLSAKLIEKSGFKAVQCSGYSFSISNVLKKESEISLAENISKTARIVESVDVPVMADGEDGYGDMSSVKNTVLSFMDVGVAGINLEDQVLHGVDNSPLCQVIDSNIMQEKIASARDVADKINSNFIINGRTDALRSTENRVEGLNIAIKRVNSYLDSGADLAFITYVETLEEVKTIIKKVKGPVTIAAGLSYNIDSFSVADLRKCGVARVSWPTIMLFSAMKSMESTLELLKEDKIKGNGDKMSYSPEI